MGMTDLQIRRLSAQDAALAHRTFQVMSTVFAEDDALEDGQAPLGVADVAELLVRPDFWVIAAIEHDTVLGGVTAHTLPMTRCKSKELFIYDLAVRTDRQRCGIGRALVEQLLELARLEGIEAAFVPADNEDDHALAFYRAIGGEALSVTHFNFDL